MKEEFSLGKVVGHIDITSIDARAIIESYSKMSFVARETANAAAILGRMVEDKNSTNILVIAGSATAGGCLKIPMEMIKARMVDVIVCTGATVIDMDMLEALGFNHYVGDKLADDEVLRANGIDRIYDTYIKEDDLQICDKYIFDLAESLEPRPYSSQEFLHTLGHILARNDAKESMLTLAYQYGVPIFVPAFSDCSAGFGLAKHQFRKPHNHMSLDSAKDFLDLSKIVIKANLDGGHTGLFMIGGGSPKNFTQDTIVCAEMLGYKLDMHKYAVQITVADPRDGACSSSTLSEARSWGKVSANENNDQMVFAEATTVWPLIVSSVYHDKKWVDRKARYYVDWLNNDGELPAP